ncbi:unnamed protein product [Brachionus calyciflorus]|uniref:PDZ domain-containing protein n=1 Tax=Brachionus calyciflorus TaxID=104777 RepID=A0A813M513_9BILA|nr:unnamed protein product [Brachionus calyciflorus]
MSTSTRQQPNEKFFSINSLFSNYSSKIDKLLLNSSTSGINTTYTSALSKYLSQSADYLTRSGTNSSITRSTHLRNSIDDLETDFLARNPIENKLSDKSDNLKSFSPITPILDNNSDVFSDCENSFKSDKLVYKSIMIIDVLNTATTTSTKMNTSTPMITKKENSIQEVAKPIIKNVIKKSFNNFYLLNQMDGDFYSYDLLEQKALEIDNQNGSSKNKKFKKTGKLTLNHAKNFRKKIRENPFVIYNQNGRKLVKKLINSPYDLESLFSSDYNEYAFELCNSKRKMIFGRKRKAPRRTIFKITKICPSENSYNSTLSNSYSECSNCSDNEYQNNLNNKNHVDLSTNEVDQSAEFARADDDNAKSSDDEFTESYGDILSNGNKEVHQPIPIEIPEVTESTEKEAIKSPEILDLIIHRLPGEKLGLNLKVEPTGSVIVVSVIENSAADRTSDLNGNRRSIQINDELLEINGVSLNNMSNEDILSVVQELPLHVSLKLKRSEFEVLASPVEANSNNEAIESGQSTPNSSNTKVPIGYNLHTVYLSSLETKCIMPCDLKECSDIEGLYKMQKSTLQIGEQDNLKKGDILYCINGDQLSFCNKFDVVSKLSNLNGIAEVSVLRKNNNCYGSHTDLIPYHNGIFAQNSIKLAMRKYDKPSIKSNSDAEMAHTVSNSKTEIFSDEMRNSLSNIHDLKKDESEFSSQIFKATLVQCKDLEAELNAPIPEAVSNDNWLLYDKNSTDKLLKSSMAQSQKFDKTEASETYKESEINTQVPTHHLSEPSLIFDQGTARSFTSSSCHSERSLIHLNCAVCVEDEEHDLEEKSIDLENKDTDSLPEYSIIVPKSDKQLEGSSKYISTCQIEIKNPNIVQNKSSNLKIIKPIRVSFEDKSEIIEKIENLGQQKSADLETLIEDNFIVEMKDMTENDCDLNSGKLTSQSSDYCKLSEKYLNDNTEGNYDKINESIDEPCCSIEFIDHNIAENKENCEEEDDDDLDVQLILEEIVQQIEKEIDDNLDEEITMKESLIQNLKENFEVDLNQNIEENLSEKLDEDLNANSNSSEFLAENSSKKLDEIFDDNLSEKLDEDLKEYLSEKLDENFNENLSEKLDENFNENLSEKLDENFDQNFDKTSFEKNTEDNQKILNQDDQKSMHEVSSSFGLKETFEQDVADDMETELSNKEDLDFSRHPDETSDTILDELEIRDLKNSGSAFDCDEPRAEVIHNDCLKNETTLSRLLNSDSDSSTSQLKHSTQIGLNLSSNLSIPPAPPLPEKLVFSSISDISTIQNSFDLQKSLDRKTLLQKKDIKPLKETSLPNIMVDEKPDKNEEFKSSENINEIIETDLNESANKKSSKSTERFNSLINPRPFNSLKNSIVKQDKQNNYCKTLLTIKKQNITFSKFFIAQAKSLFSDKSIVVKRNNDSSYVKCGKFSPINEPKIDECPKIESNSSNDVTGIVTPKCSLPANLKTEKVRKDELVIDYVESAFDKQIKQKSSIPNPMQSQSLTSSNPAISVTTLSGNGPVIHSLNLSKNENNEIEESKTEILKQASSKEIACQEKPIEEKSQLQELKQKFSVKEKIMLFTQNSESKENLNKIKIDKPKIYETKLSKSILVTSTPSIQESEPNPQINFPITKSKNSKTSLHSSKPNSTSTLNKNFTSQPNISSIEKQPELIQSIIIKDESVISINPNEPVVSESLQNFKSVRDKIAYFSSKVNSQEINVSPNSSQLNKKSNESLSSKVSNNSRLTSMIEIISVKDNKLAIQSNDDEYDSLKHAYKLKSMANSGAVTNGLGKSCMNLKFCHKEFEKEEIKQKHSSTSTLNVYNNSKLELKNFIYSNENKISDLIENLELKMKKN